jgi:hypothetical protein
MLTYIPLIVKMQRMPTPISPDESEQIEKREFEKALALAITQTVKLLKISFSKYQASLGEFFKDKDNKNLKQYASIPESTMIKLKNFLDDGILDEEVFNLHLFDFSKRNNMMELIALIDLAFSEYDELAEDNDEFKQRLFLIKIRIKAVGFSMMNKSDGFYSFISNHIKQGLITAYGCNSLQLPKCLKIQLTAKEREKISIVNEKMEESIARLIESETIKRLSGEFEDSLNQVFQQGTEGSDSRFIDRIVNVKKQNFLNQILEPINLFSASIESFEKDPDIDKIVKTILGIK